MGVSRPVKIRYSRLLAEYARLEVSGQLCFDNSLATISKFIRNGFCNMVVFQMSSNSGRGVPVRLPAPFHLIAVLLFSLAATQFGLSETFRVPPVVRSGNVVSLSQADLNGDGNQDLIYLEGAQPSTLRILVNDGNGKFTDQPITQLPFGFSGKITVADVNGDGKLDILVGAWSQTIQVAVLLGHGDGTVSDPIVSDLGAASPNWAVLGSGFAVADLNHDGNMDLVAPDSQDYMLYILIGDGTGRFKLGSKIFNGSGPAEIISADLNRDGNADVIIHGIYGADVTVYLGNADATFQTGVRYTGPHNITSFLLSDMDADGAPDLVVTNQVYGLDILRGHFDGTFDATSTGGTTFNGSWSTLLALADFNADRIADLYITSADGIGLLVGKPQLAFAASVPFATPSSSVLSFAAGDFDNDGHLDFAVGYDFGISILYGRADGSLQTADTFYTGPYLGAALGDFNGDHRLDIALAGDPYTTPLLLNDGSENFHLNQAPNSTRLGGAGVKPASGDFNGDGKADLVTLGPGYASVQFATSSNTLTAPVPLPLGSNFSFSPFSAIGVGDFNQDGRADLVIPPDILLGQGNNSFVVIQTGGNNDLEHIARRFGDVNKDGHLDLVFGGLRDIEVALGDGTGKVTNTGRSYDTSIPGSNSIDMPTSIDLAYIDGDGNLDVATTISSGPYVEIFYGKSDGTLQDAEILTVDRNYSQLILADVDQDGKPDIILNAGPTTSILHHTGARAFGGGVRYSIGTGPLIDVADMNGDGSPDLVVQNGPTSLAIAYNKSGPGSIAGAMTVQPEPSEHTKPFTLTLTFTVALGKPAPTGTVAFNLDGSQIASLPVNGNVVSHVLSITNSVEIGSHSASAVYSGDSNYQPGSFAVRHTVVPLQVATTTVLTTTLNTGLAGQTVVFTATVSASGGIIPSGTIVFRDGGTTIGKRTVSSSGSAVFDTAILKPGSHVISAEFQETPYFGASQSNSVNVQVNVVNTSIRVTADPNPAPSGSAVQLTAGISSLAGIPTGAVTFFDGPTALETRTIASDGTATFGKTFTSGSHVITATYAPNSVWNSSSSTLSIVATNPSASQAVLLGKPDFALELGNHPLLATRGTPFAIAVQLNPLSEFKDSVRFTCAVSELGAECNFQPSLLLNGHGTSQVTILLHSDNSIATSWMGRSGLNSRRSWLTTFSLCFGMLLLRPMRKARRVLPLVLCCFLMGLTIACGKGPVSQAGVVQVIVTATSGNGASATIHSKAMNINVVP